METPAGKMKGNYSGYDKDTWIPWNPVDHRRQAALARNATTAAERQRLEASGTRWTALLSLNYFDPIQQHTIDSMHCLWLGIAKLLTKHYFQSGLLSKQNVIDIQAKINT